MPRTSRRYQVLDNVTFSVRIATDAMTIHIGTSGWSYDHWAGVLYSRQATTLERLDAYSSKFRTVEINNTFYRWPKDEVFSVWHERLPAGFVASVKASRGLTQFRRLKDPKPWLDRMEAGLSHLDEKRGPLLYQLPPHFSRDIRRLVDFLSELPKGQRAAIEFRHQSWHVEETYSILTAHGAAYCVMSGAQLPCVLRATTDFVYVRLHGPDQQHLYAGLYSENDLRWWTDRLREWGEQNRDVFAYFNNDGAGHAVRNALRLQELVDG